MARKRLADLLREEAQKPGDETPTEAPAATEVEAAPSKQAGAPRRSTTPKANHAEQAVDDGSLKTALEQAKNIEAALQQQVADLKAELEDQKKLVQTLTKDLEKIEPLKAELGQAKKTALQLAEANDKLKQELEALQKQPVPPASDPPKKQDDMKRQQAAALAHPIFPTTLPGQWTNQDLGWVD